MGRLACWKAVTPRSKHAPRASSASLPDPGWVRVRRLSLIRREVHEVLAPEAVDLLWSQREQIVEGGRELGRRASGEERYYATAMVTIDLAACADLFCERADVATAERVAELMGASEAVRERLVGLVRGELASLSGRPGEALDVALEHRVRVEGVRILVDGDAVATVQGAVRARP